MRFIAFFSVCLLSVMPLGFSATVINTINFMPGEFAQDTTSGNNPDYFYSHPLPDQAIISGTLSLSHEGNSNQGPTREIWQIFDLNANLIGTLSASDSASAQDLWQLPTDVIASMNSHIGNDFNFVLSERTSFNSEKIFLNQSKLTLEVRQGTVVPEPSSVLMLLMGLTITAIGIKKAELK